MCLLLIPTAALAGDSGDCLFCHQYPGLSRFEADTGRVRLFFVDPAYTHSPVGPHSRLRCTDCHQGTEFAVVPHEPAKPVDCTGQCHLASASGLERDFSHADVQRKIEQSVHRLETLKKLEFTGGALLGGGQSLCLYCHDEPVFRDPTGALAHAPNGESGGPQRCDLCHAYQIPVNTQLMARHVAARLGPARPTLELAQVCSVCHSDPALRGEFHLQNTVASYLRSFHGKAALLGDQSTANCLSCHVAPGKDAHQILGQKDPQSATFVSNVANSCRTTACHPGADPKIAATAVHLDLPDSPRTLEFMVAAVFLLITAVSFAPSAVIVVLELVQLVVGRQQHGVHETERLARTLMQDPRGLRRLQRFTPGQRGQHWVLFLLFTVLALTGFPMKFADESWAASMIAGFGGLRSARLIHHWAGTALIIGIVVHVGIAARMLISLACERRPDGKRRGIRGAFALLPGWVQPEDIKKTLALLAHLVGLRRERPTFGRFSAAEKLEYFGVLWGTILLGLTGLMLWGEQVTSHLMGGRVFSVATIIHTYEAFLAVIHVGILHMYHVLLAPSVIPLSPAMFTGVAPAAKLAEENSQFVEAAAASLGIAPAMAPEGGPHA